jgi:hypothetical protein
MLRDEVTSMSAMGQFQYCTKNGDMKSFIDPAVYTNNRQFRLLMCHKLSDCTRTELRLSNPPTVRMFTRSCITHMEDKVWRVPAMAIPEEITPRLCTQRTSKCSVQNTASSAQPVPSPVMVFLHSLLREHGQLDRDLWRSWQSDSLRLWCRGFDPYRRRPRGVAVNLRVQNCLVD